MSRQITLELPDAEVLRLAELQLPAAQDRRLSELLALQQAGELDAEERGELASLMQCYEVSLLRKSEALADAVRRRLRGPLAP